MIETGVIDQINLDLCAQEPIRIPGGVQPHGALLVVDPNSLLRLQASANFGAFTGLAGDAPLAGSAVETELRAWLAGAEVAFLRTIALPDRTLQVSAHRTPQGVIVEFEQPPASESETLEALYPRLRQFVERLESTQDVQGLAEFTVAQVRELTGFGRVMLYSFDAEGAGHVLAEERDSSLPSYLGLHFPASDIPPQARALYQLNRMRLIPEATYQPSPVEPPLSPVDGKPLDLSLAALRSVSPVHLEYMRNMGTLSSMSISLLVDGALWGLISCHNAEPKWLNAQARTACDFLGQIVSLQIGARQRGERATRRIALKQIESDLVGKLTRSDTFQDDLAANAEAWMAVVGAQGAAFVTPAEFVAVGQTPSQPELRELVAWLRREHGEVFATDSLSAQWAYAGAFAEVASGVLAVSISQLHPSYILWFREEVVRTVSWAGAPQKVSDGERLHPRQSFALWKEQVRARSLPWSEVEVDSARDFRNAIVNLVLRHAEERAQLSEQLRATNKELEAFSYSVSHDLRAPFRHIMGYAELLSDREKALDPKSRHYLDSIMDAALSAGRLVDDLLSFSQLGRASLAVSRVDVAKLVNEIRRSNETDLAGRRVEWDVGPLPSAVGDPAMLRQVMANLIDNALKYTRGRDPARITIRAEDRGDRVAYTVGDNGVGFDMAYVGKLFGVFQRLHRSEEFPGTGIGLALVKRIIDRHGGTVFAEAVPEQGATVGFTLPKTDAERRIG